MRPFAPPLSLSHVHKSEYSALPYTSAMPVKHLQVLLGSLPDISGAAIKPHFTAFGTIISDERYYVAVILLSRGTSKATLSSFGKSHTVNSS